MATTRSRRDEPDTDGGYENHIIRNSDLDMIIKQYERESRFHTEVSALGILATTGLGPVLQETCGTHQALKMTRISGRPLYGPLTEGDDGENVAARLAAFLRLLHVVPTPGVGPLYAPSGKRWPDFLRWHLAARLNSLRLADRDRDQLWKRLDHDLHGLDPQLKPRMLHHDLKPANILFSQAGGVALCDFDQARGGDPVSDLGKLWWRTFAMARGRTWRVFLDAYGRDVTPDRLRFYLIVHCIGALAYWHDYGRPRYHGHARSAQALLATQTGVQCSLQPRHRGIA